MMSPQTLVDVTKDKAIETKDLVLNKARETVVEVREKAEQTISNVEKSTLFQSLFRVNRNLTLAGLGAVALVGDQLTEISEKCLERGGAVEEQAKDIAREGFGKIKKLLPTKKEVVAESAEEPTLKRPLSDKDIEFNTLNYGPDTSKL
jgi:polyhydroxyalkanoate synthesis regulator phasin